MLGYDSTRLLKTAMETISEIEIVVECQRQALCSIPTFAPYSAFCRIDRDARECITAQDIVKFLQENGCTKTIGECARLVRFFDSDEDGIISYADFIQMVLPCDDNLMRSQVQKRPYNRVGRFDAMPYDEESGLVTLLRHEIDFIVRMNRFVRELSCRPDYSAYAAFRTIDRYEEGAINVANLQDWFRQFGNYLSEQEVFAIIRRIDTDGDAKLSFEEFAEFFKSSVNAEAPLIRPQAPEKLLKTKGLRSAHEFATDSKYGASVEKLLNKYIPKGALQVSP